MKKVLLILAFAICSTTSFAQEEGDNLFDNTFMHQINLEAPGLENIIIWPGFYADPVKITIDGIVIDSVYLQRKGYTSDLYNNTNPPFKIDFDEFIAGQEYDGIDKFNLHNNYVDASYQRNALSYTLYRRAGVPAPHTSFAEVYINGNFIDIYTITEDIEKTFLKQYFTSNDGSLYKGQEFPPNAASVKKGTIDAFNNYVNNVNASNWGQYADLHNFFRVITIDELIYDDPGGQNDYMYFEPKSKKMHFIPWDKNLTLGGGIPSTPDTLSLLDPLVPFLNGVSYPLINDPINKPYYLKTVCELMSYLIDADFVEQEATTNYNILMTNTNGLNIPYPTVPINHLANAKNNYLSSLSQLGYSGCSSLSMPINLGDLVINEFVAISDQNGVQEPDGGTPDWIELYNNSDNDIKLNDNYYLSDDKDFLKKWHFEEDIIIPAKGYQILWADKDLHQMGIHTNFKLNGDRGDLFLVYEDLTILQEIHYEEQELNKGYARVPNGTGEFVIQAHTFNSNNDVITSVSNFENQEISLYPNPTSNIIHIKGLNQSNDVDLHIYNSLGQVVWSSSYVENIDLSSQPSGVYTLLLNYGGKRKSIRFVLQRGY